MISNLAFEMKGLLCMTSHVRCESRVFLQMHTSHNARLKFTGRPQNKPKIMDEIKKWA